MSADALHQQKSTSAPEELRDAARLKRTLGEDAVPAPKHSTAHVPSDFRKVLGWGVDLDPANRPSYPKEYPSDVTSARGDVKHWQTPPHKIHKSNEHPNLTPVFGTACPPKGLSGALRDYAYQFGEGTNRHWMTLVLSDRVDMVESMLTDALRGRPDNYFREKGWAANFKYADRAQRQRYIGYGAAVLGVVALGMFFGMSDRARPVRRRIAVRRHRSR